MFNNLTFLHTKLRFPHGIPTDPMLIRQVPLPDPDGSHARTGVLLMQKRGYLKANAEFSLSYFYIFIQVLFSNERYLPF